MKILKFLFLFIFIVLLGGFGYFAVVDIPVEQETVSKTIPNERIFEQ